VYSFKTSDTDNTDTQHNNPEKPEPSRAAVWEPKPSYEGHVPVPKKVCFLSVEETFCFNKSILFSLNFSQWSPFFTWFYTSLTAQQWRQQLQPIEPPPPFLLLLPIGSLGIVARSATTGTDLSIGDVVSPNLCDQEVWTSVVLRAGG
jgi:hypothetical protein